MQVYPVLMQHRVRYIALLPRASNSRIKGYRQNMPPLLLRDYRYEKHIHDLAMSIWWQACFQLPVCSVQRGTCQGNRSSLVADH